MLANKLSVTLIEILNPFDPSQQRREQLELVDGATLKELLSDRVESKDVVISVNGLLVEADRWAEYSLTTGDFVAVCPVPQGGGRGKDVLRIAALIAVSVLSYGVGGAIAGSGIGALGVPAGSLSAKIIGAAVGSAIALGGGSLVYSLLPIKPELPKEGNLKENSASYGIDGPKNTATEGIPVPIVYGRYRVGGNRINLYTENVTGEAQELNMLLALSEGPIAAIDIDTLEINDQPASQFDVVAWPFLGGPDQTIKEYGTSTITPHAVNAKLTTNFHTYTTSGEVDSLRLDFVAPRGFREIDKKGQSKPITRKLTVQFRKVGDTSWIPANVRKLDEFAPYIDAYYITADKDGNPIPSTRYTELPSDKYIVMGGTVYYRHVLRYPHKDQPGKYKDVPVGHVVREPNYIPYSTVQGKYASPYRFSLKLELPSQGRYEVQVKRDTEESSEDTIMDELHWVDTNEIIHDPVGYRHTALLGLSIMMGEQLNSIPKVTVEVSGVKVRQLVYRGSSVEPQWVVDWTDNPAWVAFDLFTNPRYGLGYPDSRFDLQRWLDWAWYCEEAGLAFNGVFDTEMNAWDALQYVFRTGHAQLINLGTRYTVAIERAEPPRMAFNVTNIIEQSLKINWLSLSERANEIEVNFYDREDKYRPRLIKLVNAEAQARDGRITAAVTLIGVTNKDQAVKEAELLLNLNKYVRQSIEFEAPIDAIACTVGDVVMVQHDVPQWGYGGRTGAGSTDSIIQLDRPVEMNAGDYRLLIQYPTYQLDEGTVTAIYGGRYVILSGGAVEGVDRIEIDGEDYQVVDLYYDTSGSGVIIDRNLLSGAIGSHYKLWRIDHVEVRKVLNLLADDQGETTRVQVEPFSIAPGVHLKWMFGKVGRENKLFRIMSIGYGSELTRRITALEYNDSVYIGSGQFVPAPVISDLPRGIEHVSDLFGTYYRRKIGSVYEPVIELSWRKPRGNYIGADILGRLDGGNWRQVGQVRNGEVGFTFTEAALGEAWTFKVIAVDSIGTRAPSDSAPMTHVTVDSLGADLDPPADVTVRCVGHTVHVTWTNPEDADNYAHTEVWASRGDNNRASAILLEKVAGESFTLSNPIQGQRYYFWLRTVNTDGVAGDFHALDMQGTTAPAPGLVSNLSLATPFIGTSAQFVWDALSEAIEYRVEVFTKGIKRRTQSVSGAFFAYTIADAHADGDIDRAITVHVVARDVMGQESPLPVSLTATNPPPALPTNLTITAGFKTITAAFQIPSDPDYLFTRIYVGGVTGFELGEAILKGDFAGGPISLVDLEDGCSYYVRLETHDVWGAGALSAEYHVVTQSVSDLDGLSPWATVTEADREFIEAHLEDDSIPSTKIEKLTASKIVTGTLAATEKISVEGQIESLVGGFRTVVGPRLIGNKVALFSFTNANIPIVAMYEDGSAEFTGKVTITGGTGYAALTDRPGSLADINSGEADRLNVSPIQERFGTLTASGWYRIASNPGNRAMATFVLRDSESNRHNSVQFSLGCNYNRPSLATFALLGATRFSASTFTKVRLLTKDTYDPMYVDVYVESPEGVANAYRAVIQDNYQINGWKIEPWTPITEVPSGYQVTEWPVGLNDTLGAKALQAFLAASQAQETADGKIVTFFQPTKPTNGSLGDLWFDTDDGNRLYRHNGTDFVLAQDSQISQAINTAAAALATADSKITTFFSTSEPTPEVVGDLWFNPNTQLLKRWNGSSWQNIASVGMTEIERWVSLSSRAGSWMETFNNAVALEGWQRLNGIGELSIVTEGQDRFLRIGNNSGNDETHICCWELIPFDPNAIYKWTIRVRRIAGDGLFYFGFAGIASDGQTHIVMGGSYHYHGGAALAVPSTWTEIAGYTRGYGATTGTVGAGTWDNPSKAHPDVRYMRPFIIANYQGKTGITDIDYFSMEKIDPSVQSALQAAAQAQETADGKIVTFFQPTKPTNGSLGDLWFDTDDGNKVYRHNGSDFVPAQDSQIGQAINAAAAALATADSKITTYFATSAPNAEVVGDLWFNPNTNLLKRWDGSDWQDIATFGMTEAERWQAMNARAGDWMETFNDAVSLGGWQRVIGTGEMLVVTEGQDRFLRVGNNSGDDSAWILSNQLIPFDPNAIYKWTIRIRRVAGQGTFYFGFAGYAADGITPVNALGQVSNSSQHYHGAAGSSGSLEWAEYTGYTSGYGSGWQGPGTWSNPAKAHPNVRYMRPYIIANYQNATGIMDIDYVAVTKIDASVKEAGETADWSKVTGPGKPQDNATVGAQWGVNLTNIPARFGDNDKPSVAGLYLTQNYMGYHNGNGQVSGWRSYIQKDGQFHFGDTNQYVDWNGLTLNIRGNITITGGSGWANLSDRPADEDILNYQSANGVTLISHPQGGQLSHETSNVVGAIKIRLPVFFTSSMIRFEVDVFNYVTGTSFKAEISGYNYLENQAWLQVTAKISGNSSANHTVRFGHDGERCCVWIGETTTVWQYPKVVVRNLQVGFSNGNPDIWKKNWAVSIAQSFGTVQQTISNTLGGASWSQLQGTPPRFGDNDTPTVAGLYLTPTHMGYHNGNGSASGWQSYIQNDGQFHFGSGNQYVDWNGSTLSIRGNVTITGGSGWQNLSDRPTDTAIMNNLIDPTIWQVWTTGSQGPFDRNGDIDENAVIQHPGPYGVTETVWECRPKGDANADGGWNHFNIPVDYRKSYRLVVWVKKSKAGGYVYLGCDTSGHTANLNGTVNNNPYFWTGELPQFDKWYLLVGIIHHYAYTGGVTELSGLWDPETGLRVSAGTDFKMVQGATVQTHRAYLYYSSDPTVRVQFTRPRFDELNGNEPTLESILGRPRHLRSTPTVGLNMTPYYMGYFDGSTWRSYMDNQGRFELKSSQGHYLQWNGSTLTVRGDVQATSVAANVTLSAPVISGGMINGVTLTGGTIQTSFSNAQRAVLDGSTNSLKFYFNGVVYADIGTNYYLAHNVTGYFRHDTGSAIVGYGRTGVYGQGGQVGVYGRVINGTAVQGRAEDSGDGVVGETYGIEGYGVVGEAYGSYGIGVVGLATGSNSTGVQGAGQVRDFYATGPGINYASFTGAHDALVRKGGPSDPLPLLEEGDIMVVKRIVARGSTSNIIPELEISQIAQAKNAYGVVMMAEELPESVELGPVAMRGLPQAEYDNYRSDYYWHTVNAVGEGQINVCDENGDFEVGDFICTSNMPGKGMRYDGNDMRVVVAKIMESVDWSEVEPDELGRKVKKVACIYMCG